MRMRMLTILVLCLALAASSAFAGRTVTATRLGDYEVDELAFSSGLRSDCQVGNLNAGAWAIGDWVWGAEGYKYLFYPPETCSCPIGFHLENVHLLIQFGVEDVPSSFDVYVDLEEAVWDDLLGCYYPGPETCTSLVYTVDITTDGLYDISIPIYDECECAYMDYWYFLSFHFVTTFDSAMRPDLIADDFPLGCRSWNDYGFGWQDLVNDFGWPGEILMWGDVICCEFPVATEPETWGGVKNLYK